MAVLTPTMVAWTAWIRNRIGAHPWLVAYGIPGALSIAVAVLYLFTAYPLEETTFPALATALLDGHLSVPWAPTLELVPVGDRGYVPLPPVPALVHLPLIALDLFVAEQLLAVVVGGTATGLAFAILARMRVAIVPASLITVGVATSTLWYVVSEGGRMWMFAHVVAVAFGLAAILVAWSARWPLAAGVLLGLAAGSRLPMGLMLPVLLYCYRVGRWRAWLPLLAGVSVVALPIALYNLARFGSPLDFGYAYIPSGACEGTVLCEPWYADGIMSLNYIPRSIGAALLSGFAIRNEAPWVLAPGTSLSLALTAPVLLLATGAGRSRMALVLWSTVALVMLPNLAHGNWGFWQYGYRYILDALPLLVVLLGLAYRERATWRLAMAVAAGAASTTWGLLLFHVWRLAP